MTNNTLTYILSALIIIIIAAIVVFHYYSQLKVPSIPVTNTSISSPKSSTIPPSHSINSISTLPVSNYNSSYPLAISGLQRVQALQIPVSKLPANFSAGLSRATDNVYRNITLNNTLIINELSYFSNINSSIVFNNLKSSTTLKASHKSSIKLLNNLPANYLGITTTYKTENIEDIAGYNNTKVCLNTYMSPTPQNQTAVIQLLENASKICFAN